MNLKDATVLVVDDEAALVDIVQGWFQREGCRVLTAENGAQALELVRANQIDAVVSDIRMPVMDGIGLAKSLKARGGHAPRIVFVSGFTDVSERDCFDLGVEAILSKPVKRPNLLAVVQRSLIQREMLWREPVAATPAAELDAVFPSLPIARERGLIAFGRGGVCLRSTVAAPVDRPIALHLEFAADRLALVGQGIVRWADHRDDQIGIEIVHVDDAHRGWVARLAEQNDSMSFIPRSSAPGPA